MRIRSGLFLLACTAAMTACGDERTRPDANAAPTWTPWPTPVPTPGFSDAIYERFYAYGTHTGDAHSLRIGDLDLDGFRDLVVGARYGGDMSTPVIVFRNDGTGHFHLPAYYPTGYPNGVRNVWIANVDGDTAPDLVALISHYLVVLRASDLFSIQYVSDIGISSGGIHADLADVDMDGDADAAVATNASVRLMLAEPSGTYVLSASTSYSVTASLGDVSFATLGTDGNPDLAVLLRASGYEGIRSFPGTGSAALAPSAEIAEMLYGMSFTTGDFDGDSIDDFVVSMYLDAADDLVLVLSSTPGQPPVPVTHNVATVHRTASGDVNGDGFADLVLASAGVIETLLGQGDGTFAAGHVTELPYLAGFANAVGLPGQLLALGDLDGDGRDEVIVAGGDILHVFYPGGDGT